MYFFNINNFSKPKSLDNSFYCFVVFYLYELINKNKDEVIRVFF